MEGAEDGPSNIEAQENDNTNQAMGGNNTPSRAPSADVSNQLSQNQITIMID